MMADEFMRDYDGVLPHRQDRRTGGPAIGSEQAQRLDKISSEWR